MVVRGRCNVFDICRILVFSVARMRPILLHCDHHPAGFICSPGLGPRHFRLSLFHFVYFFLPYFFRFRPAGIPFNLLVLPSPVFFSSLRNRAPGQVCSFWMISVKCLSKAGTRPLTDRMFFSFFFLGHLRSPPSALCS